MTKNTNFMPSEKTKDEVKAIKEDIKDVFERIGNMKEESLKVFSEDYEELLSKMYSFKDKMMGYNGKTDAIKAVDYYVQRHPMKTALYCVGLGMLIAKCFKK